MIGSFIPACRTCAANLIVVTMNGQGAKAMDGDVIDR